MASLLVLLTAVATVFGARPVSANTTDQFATVEIGVLEQIPWEAGLPIAAEVTVEADRAVSGELILVSNSDGQASTTYEFDVDIGADTVVTLPVELFTGWDGVVATATLAANGQVIAGDDLRVFGQGNTDHERVAVLGIESPPQRVPLVGGDAQLRVFSLDDRLNGLERASTLVATPGAVAGLGDGTDEALRVEAWIRGGGQLVVDGARDSLADSFQRHPTANPDRYLLGAGSIIYLEDWEDGVPLGGYVGRNGLRELVESQDLGSGAAGELAILAGISLPSARTVALILLAYSLVAGPLAYVVLAARGQVRKMWVVLPCVSALFVVGILGFGIVTRTGRSDTHITIVEVNEQASRATSNLLLTSSVGGSRGIETPAGWSYLGQGRTEAQRPVRLRTGGSTTEISIETPPGGSSLARVSGVASQFDGLLSIDNIRYDNDMILAEVTNNGAADLIEVQAILGNARTEIGSLPAGESVSFEVAARDASGRTMRELLNWPRVRREWTNRGQIAVPTDRDAPTAAGAWTEWRTEQGSAAMPETTLGVVGWTDDLAGPVAGIEDGRTALFVRENLPADVSRSLAFTTTARLASRNGEPVFNEQFEGYAEDYRVTLSDGFDPDSLAVLADRNSAAIGFLTPDGWRYARLEGRGEVTVAVPATAIVDGEVTLRSYTPPWIWGAGLTLTMVLDADAESIDLTEEPRFRNVDGGDFGFEGPGPMADEPRFLAEGLVTVVEESAEGDDPRIYDGSVIAGTYDAYVVTLEAGAELVATMSSGRGDSYLELVDENGLLLLFNDDYGRNVDSQIQFVADRAGVYEIRAQDLGTGSIDYSLQIEVTP
ncbi:MAG: PPC domain-containing protein [Actinomycetota bacterium]